MHRRQDILEHIRSHPEVSVLILGGGINGLGLYREMALQGVDCLLVDKADFAAGASSKSSRMIHGGLRYLEQGDFKLVRESLLERNRLLENAAHTVSPLKTTIPLFSWLGGLIKSPLCLLGFPVKPGGRGALLVKAGLSFYDFVTRKQRKTPRHFLSSRARTLREMRGIHEGIVCSATYWDARIIQAERLCIELLRDARDCGSGSHAINYVSPVGVEEGMVLLQDGPTGETLSVRPRVVANATGGWVDITNGTLGLKTLYMGGTKGSHLVVSNDALRDALGDRMVYYEHADGRVCIVFAFEGKVILGSTDIRVDDPDEARCEDAEVDYMLSTLKGVFPGIEVSRDEIVYKFCGVRPLPRSSDAVTGKISRNHRVDVNEPDRDRPFPVFSLIGGKWTTFRAFAEHTADQVLRRLEHDRVVSTHGIAIGGGRDFPADAESRAAWIERVATRTGIGRERIATLLDRYGTLAEEYASGIEKAAETPLGTLPHYTREEIAHIVREDSVEHLTDLICRRTLIAILGEARRDVLGELAGIAGEELGWDAARREAEVALALEEMAGS